MILVIWEYRVNPAYAEIFERNYGRHGDWIILFERFQGYLGSELLKKKGEPNTYITIDRWESEDLYHKFLFAAKEEYEMIDEQCSSFTLSEVRIGVFEE